MRLFYTLLFTATVHTAFSQHGTLPAGQAFQVPVPLNAGEKKVIVSDEDNNFEISPSSSFNNGLLLEPVNQSTNRGVPAAFYIRDTASWSFYTDAQKRLSIKGDGVISITSRLQVNQEEYDGVSALRVNGIGRFDSSLFVYGAADSNFISINRNVKNSSFDVDDSISPYTVTPTAWALNRNIPVFRIRHPMDVLNIPGLNSSIKRDFKIVPYEYGMAIEYNGTVECWVGEWSIHKGVNFFDNEGKNNGWGAVLWVGDDVDRGGVRGTARNNIELGGNVLYGELSVETFGGLPHGDFRLRLPSTDDDFQFVYGERGSTNIIAKLKNQGLVIPKIASVSLAQSPDTAQLVYDSTDNQFKGYTGSGWTTLSGSQIKTGSYTRSSTGNDSVFVIPHGLGSIPSYFNVVAASRDAANISYVTADAVFIYIYYTGPLAAGVDNISWNWMAKP